ncbi:MAG: hypothetical protein A3G87_06350 [Omnitrophica bacterium RIFCSPLOWO2_12_FULL_50_11]|nr:MAG: hypothetical protein A3G87_06350 [Omnitrophica bacterium RIFCSPLOWO2_12_FULL_50_11]
MLKKYMLFTFGTPVLLCALSTPAFSEITKEGWYAPKGGQVRLSEAKRFYEAQKSLPRGPSPKDRLAVQAAMTASPEIQSLARALKYDPKLIYDYVHNHIDYTPYYGALKGATLTLLEGSGNDFDQASLLIALLRESGYPAKFVIGTQTIPGNDLANWLGGLGNSASNPRWQRIHRMLSWHGIPYEWAGTGGDTARVARVWVQATIDGVDYLFDPAFKIYAYFSELMNISTFNISTGHNISNFMAEVTSGATIGTDYVQNLNETNLRNKLAQYTSAVVNKIRDSFPNSPVRSVYGGRKIFETNLKTYRTSLPFPSSIDAVTDQIDAQYQTTFRFQMEGIDITFNTEEIAEKRLTITFTESDFRPELRLNGVLVAQGNATSQDYYYDATITIDHPFAYNNGTYFDQVATYRVLSGDSTYAIIKVFGVVADKLIQRHRDEIVKNLSTGSLETSEEVLGESLHVIGLTWNQEIFRAATLLAPSFDIFYTPMHSIGMVHQTSNYLLDMPQIYAQAVNIGPIDDDQVRGSFIDSTWAVISAFEHAVLEQLVDPQNPGISTIKLLQRANEQGKKIFKANSSNYTTILPQLEYYDPDTMSLIVSRILDGNTLILPERGDLDVGGSWHGAGYVWFQTPGQGAGFWISGRYFGGTSSDPGNVDPDALYDRLKKHIPDHSTRVDIDSYTSKDPVNMASGAFVFDHVDLALGGDPPLGLSLARSYNSSSHFSKRNLGFGWTHDYDIRLSRTGHAQPGLGLRTPADAAPLLTALRIAYDVIYQRTSDELAYATVALIFKWAMDQLIENAVTVHIGSRSIEFIKLPDGTYVSPPGITTKLVDNGNGTLSLQERFGTHMDFDTNGRLQNWRDVDGNNMTFTYTGDKLSMVQDEFHRSLAFSYTGENLTSVSDSEGRSVSYGYDGQNNLTTYTDPENKVWTYGYDGVHQLTSLTNPLGITTVTNVYDSEDRVKTQTAPRQGGGTATYNFSFSGFRNVEEDPFGRQTIYHLDEIGRTMTLENALGFKTDIVYDGQNHEIRVWDPRGNFTTFTYNGDHNVTKITNAVSQVTLFRYDPDLRLHEIEDPLHHISYLDYDTEHHVTQTTNAENDRQLTSYYANGQVESVVDGRNIATTFFYDPLGQLESARVAPHPPIQYGFDPIGRMRELTDNENAQTLFDYDKRNLPLKSTDPLLKEVLYTYDDAGRLLTRKDRKSDLITYSYTPTGKVDTVTYPDLSTVHFTYNLHDQLTDMADLLGTTHFERDALYRLTTVTDPHGFTVSYDYDEAGNVTKITYPGGKEVLYTYDPLNRLKTVTNWLGQTATYEYDQAGRFVSLTHFNGIQTTYDYDDANRLIAVEHKDVAANNIIARYTYALDGNGNRTSIDMLAPLMPTIETMNVPYTYNPEKNRLIEVGGVTLTYDDEGQLQTMGGVTHTFDFEHRLTSVGNSAYEYDGVGTRLRSIHFGIEIRYVYDLEGNLLAEANANNEIVSYYVHGLGLLAMVTPQDETFSYHYDGTGNTIAITDHARNIQNTYAYTPFGITTENESFHQPFTFSGEYGVTQEPNGLYYMRARYYDPVIGRFISEDPIGFAGGDVNLFAYVGNNPINFIDPYGYWGFGLDVSVTGEAGATQLGGAAAATASAGGGVFVGNNATSLGGFTSYGGFVNAGGATPPTQPWPTQTATGAYGGGGAGLFFTNATSAGQLAQTSSTTSIDIGVPWIPYLSASIKISQVNGIWMVSVQPPFAGLGAGFGTSTLDTVTKGRTILGGGPGGGKK